MIPQIISTLFTLPQKDTEGNSNLRYSHRHKYATLVGLLSLLGSVIFLGCVIPDGVAILASKVGLGPRLELSDGQLDTIQAHDDYVLDIAFSPDGNTLATASSDGTVRLWQVETHAQQRQFPHPTEVFSVAFSPDGSLLASGSLDGKIRMWQLETGNQTFEMDCGEEIIRCVAFSPDGTTLAAGTEDGPICLWRVRDEIMLHYLEKHTVSIKTLAFASDGSTLASVAPDMSVVLWNVDDGSILQDLSTKGYDVIGVTFSSRDTILAIGNGFNEMWLEEWSLPKGIVINEWETKTSLAFYAAFSPVSDIVATSNGNIIETWRIKNGKKLLIQIGPPTGGIVTMAYSPDGKILAAGTGDGSVWLWPAQP